MSVARFFFTAEGRELVVYADGPATASRFVALRYGAAAAASLTPAGWYEREGNAIVGAPDETTLVDDRKAPGA